MNTGNHQQIVDVTTPDRRTTENPTVFNAPKKKKRVTRDPPVIISDGAQRKLFDENENE